MTLPQTSTLLWMAAGIAAATLAASLIPGPYAAAVDGNMVRAAFLETSDVDADVKATLQRTCQNCHSFDTEWPWYSRVAPASWLLRKDVLDGRRFLNFSRWPEYGSAGQGQLLALAAADLKNGTMPPKRYLLLHPEARLSDAQRSGLIAALERESARVLAPASTDQ